MASATSMRQCAKCGKDIAGKWMEYDLASFHPECFTCTSCGHVLGSERFFEEHGKPVCRFCFVKEHGRPCTRCGRLIDVDLDGTFHSLECNGKPFHKACFTCSKCDIHFDVTAGGPEVYEVNGELFCKTHAPSTATSSATFSSSSHLGIRLCTVCKQTITERALVLGGEHYHPDCFKCKYCHCILDKRHFMRDDDGRVACVMCYNSKHGELCKGCYKIIDVIDENGVGCDVIRVGKEAYHLGCYKCSEPGCGKPLWVGHHSEGYVADGRLVCHAHAHSRAHAHSAAGSSSLLTAHDAGTTHQRHDTATMTRSGNAEAPLDGSTSHTTVTRHVKTATKPTPIIDVVNPMPHASAHTHVVTPHPVSTSSVATTVPASRGSTTHTTTRESTETTGGKTTHTRTVTHVTTTSTYVTEDGDGHPRTHTTTHTTSSHGGGGGASSSSSTATSGPHAALHAATHSGSHGAAHTTSHATTTTAAALGGFHETHHTHHHEPATSSTSSTTTTTTTAPPALGGALAVEDVPDTTCLICKKDVTGTRFVIDTLGAMVHQACMQCMVCHTDLIHRPQLVDESDRAILCVPCYNAKHATMCSVCDKRVDEVDDNGKGLEVWSVEGVPGKFHRRCLACAEPGCTVDMAPFMRDGRFFCAQHCESEHRGVARAMSCVTKHYPAIRVVLECND